MHNKTNSIFGFGKFIIKKLIKTRYLRTMQKIVLLFFVLFSCLGIAQNKKEKEMDSLFRIVQQVEILDQPSDNKNISYNTGELLKISTEIYYQSKEAGYIEGQAKALLPMISYYIRNGNIKEALKKINEGINLTENNDKYLKYTALFYISKARAISKLGHFNEALEDYKTATELIARVPGYKADAERYGKIYRNNHFIFSSDLNQHQLVLSRREKENYLLDSYNQAQKLEHDTFNRTMTRIICQRLLISAYIEWGEFDKAEKYLSEGDLLYKNKFPWVIIGKNLRGFLEQKKKNYTKALEYYEQALKQAKRFGHRYDQKDIYLRISQCYRELKDYEKESYYLEKQKKLSDSLNLAERESVSEVLEYEKKENVSEESFLSSAKPYYIIGALLSVALFIFIKRRFTKKASVDHITESPVGNEEEQLNHETLSLLINLAEQDDPSFYLKFNEIFPGFSENLLKISPKLTQSDMEYCAMMKLNFDTKKIASIKRLSIGAVESKKYRIRKKLDISTEENIYVWLMDK